MKSELLERETYAVEIEGRIFTLKEMSARDNQKYIKEMHSLEIEFNEENLEALLENLEEKMIELVKWVLGKDQEGEIVTKEWIEEHLTLKMLSKVFEIQNKLNGLDELLKKVMLRQVQMKAEAAKG